MMNFRNILSPFLRGLGRASAPILVLCSLVSLGNCTSHGRRYSEHSGEVFHTFYHIKHDGAETFRASLDSIYRSFSLSLNPFEGNSLISRINLNQESSTDSLFREVWLAATRISEASGGSYDVTATALINAWGFGFEDSKHIPSERELDSLKTFTGYKLAYIDSVGVLHKKDPRVRFNFSSIAKGYCSDLVAKALASQGAQNYMVEIGGEIAFRGLNPSGKPWRIGITRPEDNMSGVGSEIELIVELPTQGGGLATSGNYRNYKIRDGKRYGHTVDPRTGHPIQTDVLSVTILSESSMLSDGLSTACMTMMASDIPAFLSQFPGTEYLVITGSPDGGYLTQTSQGFERLIVERQAK